MGRVTTILKVFVASPSDLADERAAVDRIARELNQIQSERTGAFLDVVKWETHALPGVGSDPQALVNDSVADNYDIFIGILSTRFGSTTPRAGSGTEEEFDRAYARFLQDPQQLRIMFYFKDPIIKASEIDLDQYALVKAFQKKLGKTGLYFEFSSTDEFTSLVRIHLNKQIQDWADGKWGGKCQSSELDRVTEINESTLYVTANDDDDDAELGYLDYIESIQENLKTATETLDRMLTAINQLAQKTEENTPKLNREQAKGDVGRSKLIVNNVAREMIEFSQRMETDMPIFSRSYSTAMDAISKSAALWESDFNQDMAGLENTHAQIQELILGIAITKESMLAMQQTIVALPRLTAQFNKGKKHASDALLNFDRELTSALKLTTEVQGEVSRMLQPSAMSDEDAVMEIADYLRTNVSPRGQATLVRFEQLTALGLTMSQVSQCFLAAADKASCDVIDKSPTRATVKRKPPAPTRLVRA